MTHLKEGPGEGSPRWGRIVPPSHHPASLQVLPCSHQLPLASDLHSPPSPFMGACITGSSNGNTVPGKCPVLRLETLPDTHLPNLTLLSPCVAMKQGVEQQLEGGGRPQAAEQLQDVGFRQEPFAPIEGLRTETEDGSEPCPAKRWGLVIPC